MGGWAAPRPPNLLTYSRKKSSPSFSSTSHFHSSPSFPITFLLILLFFLYLKYGYFDWFYIKNEVKYPYFTTFRYTYSLLHVGIIIIYTFTKQNKILLSLHKTKLLINIKEFCKWFRTEYLKCVSDDTTITNYKLIIQDNHFSLRRYLGEELEENVLLPRQKWNRIILSYLENIRVGGPFPSINKISQHENGEYYFELELNDVNGYGIIFIKWKEYEEYNEIKKHKKRN